MGSITPSETTASLTALVKGAGPSGLAAAVSLAQLDFTVTVVEKRPWRPYGAGRRNMVAVRPDALHTLDELGALRYLVEVGALTDMVEGLTVDEWLSEEEGRFLVWNPLFRRYPHSYGPHKETEKWNDRGDTKEYQKPSKVSDQLPCCYVDLGELEDALLKVCEKFENVKVINGSTVELKSDGTGNKYQAFLVECPGTSDGRRIDLGCPDLIVGASGKNDADIANDLGFTRKRGVKLDEDVLPGPDSRDLRLGAEEQLETQQFAVFGVVNPTREMGSIHHLWRKDGTGEPPQPICEIEMSHKGVSHCVLHLPRGMDVHDKPELERYLIDRVNEKLGMKFRDLRDMREQGVLVAGDPLQPVLVESSTAPKFVYGFNVVLVGDVAMCCSPSSGIGADLGVSADSQNIKQLGHDIAQIREMNVEDQAEAREQALSRFNVRKAEAAIIWSQASRKFYISEEEAKNILAKLRYP